ncbi:vascular endothelial growth factor A-like protein [Leptotrombidium deliense]|uniref:Vascular endothelial growth factor A-like protein n=1 Tax=Leptotrombidium deliense TaxID=299467 RepID=A0A443SR61_9ACAR|nr:vascular endothelial growth factor A-like protein [Leptotrombidium deliense]
MITDPAGCTPEMKTVQLNPVKAESELYFPWCVKLPRCSGCCPSRRLECVATKVTKVDITGVKLQYSPISRKFKFKGLKVFKMDKHEQCSCQCIQKPADCTSTQVYRPEECRCVCRDMQNVIKCLQNHEKIWDRNICACKCKATLKCSTGFFFNDETCRCESIKKLDDTSLIPFAPNILRTNDNREVTIQRFKGREHDGGINPEKPGAF